jgi:hypothetical protein
MRHILIVMLLATVCSSEDILKTITDFYAPKVAPYLQDLKYHNYRDMIFYKGDPQYMFTGKAHRPLPVYFILTIATQPSR